MNHGPCCPIHQSTLDSPDYWTDPALMSSATPASSTEWRRWDIESRSRHAKWATRHGQWQTKLSCFMRGLMKTCALFFLCFIEIAWFLRIMRLDGLAAIYMLVKYHFKQVFIGFVKWMTFSLSGCLFWRILFSFVSSVFPLIFRGFLDEPERSLPRCLSVLGWWPNWVRLVNCCSR